MDERHNRISGFCENTTWIKELCCQLALPSESCRPFFSPPSISPGVLVVKVKAFLLWLTPFPVGHLLGLFIGLFIHLREPASCYHPEKPLILLQTMAMKRGEHLPRLSIAQNINMQQPIGPMYAPALPTAIQQSFHPAFPMGNPLQTPMQSFFTPGIPGAPARPTHRPNAASMQLAAAGIHPPPQGFMTPVSGHFPRPSISLNPAGQPAPSHPFPGRNRRQLSIGGPPKAVLGGPARKLSPMPEPAPAPEKKKKKLVVNLPQETLVSHDGESQTSQEWARHPFKGIESTYSATTVVPAEISTAEIYPPDSLRTELPSTIDVYLPGRVCTFSELNSVIYSFNWNAYRLHGKLSSV